ncbi:MAG: type II secretion system F family protein [Candidatus Omnitrophica bacterium]|nr:type II secretion system F family protein [Candidatus Omnitrophota bacterium]
MATYKYKAKKGPNEIIESLVIAASEEEAIERINQMGYLPVKIEEVMSGDNSFSGTNLNLAGISSKRITIFTKQFSILLKSGVPILNALNVLLEQSEQQNFKNVISEMHKDVKDGKAFSVGLSRFPKLFPPLYIALVRAGENSGKLEDTLLRIAEYRDKQEKIFATIRTALTYPILMGCVGTATIVFMLTFVMPRLLKIFSRLGQELPLPTRIIIITSDFLRQNWPWLFLAVFAMVVFLKYGCRSKRERMLLGSLKLHLPIFGNMFLKSELARFSRTLGLLLGSGIQLLRAIKISVPILNNEVIRESLDEAYGEVEKGESLAATLGRRKIFPRFMINLIGVGEESGRVEETLEEVALIYEAETDEAVKVLTNLLEPLMILIMGAVGGFIIIAMLLPVFQINMMIN